MRPTDTESGQPIYECLGCGKREREPDSRTCPACGSSMRNIGHPRDS